MTLNQAYVAPVVQLYADNRELNNEQESYLNSFYEFYTNRELYNKKFYEKKLNLKSQDVFLFQTDPALESNLNCLLREKDEGVAFDVVYQTGRSVLLGEEPVLPPAPDKTNPSYEVIDGFVRHVKQALAWCVTHQVEAHQKRWPVLKVRG